MRLTEWRGEHAAIANHRENYIDKLAAYEDAEEQGRLVILPCKVGETVWRVNFDKRRKRIEEIRFDVNVYNAFGKTVFLTREEAEAALQEKKYE